MSVIPLKYPRIVHNSLIFTISLFISFYSHIPFAFWVSATVLAIMIPLESGLIANRVKGVFWGTIQGLILFIPLWALIDLDSELIFVIIPLCLSAMFFYQIHDFSKNVVFLNINLGLFLEYIQYGSYHFSFYLVARIMTILIGIALAGIGEILFTHRKNYGYNEFIASLRELAATIQQVEAMLTEFRLGYSLIEQQSRLIVSLTKLNGLLLVINEHYNSMLVEQSSANLVLISSGFAPLSGWIKEYKLCLLGVGYAVGNRDETSLPHNFSQLTFDLKVMGDKIINRIESLQQV